jgi:hypothetical protein
MVENQMDKYVQDLIKENVLQFSRLVEELRQDMFKDIQKVFAEEVETNFANFQSKLRTELRMFDDVENRLSIQLSNLEKRISTLEAHREAQLKDRY